MAINLGDINFGLGPDTTRLERARRRVLEFGQAVNKAATETGKGARQTETAMRRQEKAIVDSLGKIQKLNNAIRQTGANPAQFKSTTATFNRLVKELANGKVSALQFQRSMEDVNVSLGRVSRAIQTHQANQARLAREERDAAKAATEQTKAILRQEKAMFQATQAVERYNAAVSRTQKAPASLTTRANSALSSYKGSMSIGMDPIAAQRASQTFQAAMNRNVIALQQFKNAQRGVSDSRIVQSLDRLSNVAVLLNGPLGGVAARLSLVASVADRVNLKVAALVVGIAGASYAFVQLGKNAIASSKIFQRAEMALNSLNESTTLTQVQMGYLMDLADRTGTAFGGLSSQFARMSAASAGTNLEGERMREIFESVTLAGAKMSLSSDEIAGTLKAVEQIMSKGTLQAEELRGQLGDRIPGAVQIMARALNVSTQELGKLMKQGRITSDSLLPFAQELARTYGVELGDGIDTVVTAEGRLVNALVRFNRAADEAIGFSEAYQNTLNGAIGLVNTLSDNMDVLIKYVGAAGAAFVGLFAPQIIGGLWALVGVIRAATVAMLGLNVAVMANPLGALASVLVRVTLAAGAAVGAFHLLDKAMDSKKTKSMSDAIWDNARALRSAASASATFRKELKQTIELQHATVSTEFESVVDEYSDARKRLMEMSEKPKGVFGFLDDMAINNQTHKVRELESKMSKLRNQAKMLGEQWVKIKGITGDEKPLSIFGDGSDAGANKVAKTIRDAKQAITEMDEQFKILQMPKHMQEWATIQLDLNKRVEDFKDKLTDAKVPAGQIVSLTDRYSQSLRTLEEGRYILENQVSAWEAFGNVMGKGLDSAFDTFIDATIDGKDALMELRDVGKAVATDLLKTFVQLAAINPLKNALFGQRNDTLSSGGGIGGFLSGIFGNLIGNGGGSPINLMAARGMAVTSGGNRFRKGGTFSQPQMFQSPQGPILGGEAGDEGLLPLGRNSKGQLAVHTMGGEKGQQVSGGDFIANFYLSANGDETIMEITKEAVGQAFKVYNTSFTQRTAAANLKGRTRRIPGAR